MAGSSSSMTLFEGAVEATSRSRTSVQQNDEAADIGADAHALARHKRTRSGCYTCRKRRVKCDETRPRCHRCLKGDRECSFPPEKLAMSKKQRAYQARKLKKAAAEASVTVGKALVHIINNGAGQTSEQAESSDPDDSDNISRAISGDSAEQDHNLQGPGPNSSVLSPSSMKADPIVEFPNVPPSIAKLFLYHRENLTHCHYFLSTDAVNFFERILYIAHQSPPLMFSIAAFTTYHYALHHGEKYLEDMFKYYEECVKSLMHAIEAPDLNTLIAILILSCIEMYLGDVSNEIQHQDAAFSLFQSMYTTQTAFQTDMQLYLFIWMRFIDIRRSLISGRSMSLGSEWHSAHRQIIHDRLLSVDQSPQQQIMLILTSLGAIFSELCDFASNVRERRLSGASAIRQIELLRAKSLTWFESLDPQLFEIEEVPANCGLSDDDLSLVPPLLYKRWQMGLMMIVFNGYKLYFSAYAALSTTGRIEDPEATSEVAVLVARLVAGFEAAQTQHPGALFVCHNYLCLAAAFIPPKYHVWIRRKLAMIQGQGYYFPDQIRMRIASAWGNEDLYRGWLEGLDPDDYVAKDVAIPWERLAQVQIPECDSERGNFTADVREMRGIFDTGVAMQQNKD
ncbi:hypothetical protein V1512DRAFT_139132 [Lipomyces arxii]|uniref:uncharacterized protein n=1 Tax=Lipomyces arxii TaxID=56418 RepID=UPI0034CE8C44